MRVITVEEHYESAKVSSLIQAAAGATARPNVSAEMANYMKTTLPTPAVMQDVTGARLQFMARNNIDMQVLSYGNSSPQNLPPKDAIAISRVANDELAAVVAADPQHFAGLAVLPVGDPQAAATELKRAVQEKGLKGVLLKGNYGGKFFDDPFFLPIFEHAAALDVPVYFHPSFIPNEITAHYFASDQWSDVVTGIMSSAGYGWHMDVGVQVMRMIISGIFDKLPNLKLISGHWGELLPQFLERFDDEFTKYDGLKHPFSYYYRHNVYVTPSGILAEPQLRFMLDEMGPDHLLFSVDYPYKQPANIKAFLNSTSMTPSQRDGFAGGNAAKLLKL